MNSVSKSISDAMRIVSNITVVGIMMALPPIAGAALDNYLEISSGFSVIGLICGLPLSLWYLLKVLKNEDD